MVSVVQIVCRLWRLHGISPMYFKRLVPLLSFLMMAKSKRMLEVVDDFGGHDVRHS